MGKPVKIAAFLAKVPLFCEMSAEEIERVAQNARELHLSRGEVLFQRGDPSLGFFVVVYGKVKLALSSPKGIEKVVELIGPGQSFGEAVMFMDKPYPVYAQALIDTLVIHIGKNEIVAGIEGDPVFCRKMLAGLSIRLHGLIQNVESLSLHSSEQRVIDFVLQHLEGINEGQDIHISLSDNKNVIASKLNVTPETFSRILHSLSEAGLIKVDGKDVCIRDVGKLRNYEV